VNPESAAGRTPSCMPRDDSEATRQASRRRVRSSESPTNESMMSITGACISAAAMRASDLADIGLPDSAVLIVAGLSRASRAKSIAAHPRRAISLLKRLVSTHTLTPRDSARVSPSRRDPAYPMIAGAHQALDEPVTQWSRPAVRRPKSAPELDAPYAAHQVRIISIRLRSAHTFRLAGRGAETPALRMTALT